MKGFSLGVLAGVILTSLAVWLGSRALDSMSAKASDNFTRTVEAGGLRVTTRDLETTIIVFSRGTEEFQFQPANAAACWSPIVSPDGRSAYVLISDKQNPGAQILAFDFGDNPLSFVTPKRLFGPNQGNASAAGTLNDLFRISPDGRRLLVSLLTLTSKPDGSALGREAYRNMPYWFDIEKGTFTEP